MSGFGGPCEPARRRFGAPGTAVEVGDGPAEQVHGVAVTRLGRLAQPVDRQGNVVFGRLALEEQAAEPALRRAVAGLRRLTQ